MIDDLELARTLLEQGIANRDQLRQARQLQLTQDTSLYLAMIDHSIIEEPLLVEVVAGLLNVPFVTLSSREVSSQVANLVPVDMARLHGVLPLELREDSQGELLLLAMRDPLDIMAMDEISTHVNVGIQPILCGPKDLLQAIERLQADQKQQQASLSIPRNNSVDFGEFSTPAEHEQDSLSSEDSWGVFFDDALSQPEPSSSREMRDRAVSTMALDLMDIDEILDDDQIPSQDSVSLLDEPGEPSSVEMDSLNGWEVDSSLGSKGVSSPPPPPLPSTPASPSIFDALHAAIDHDLPADGAPSGTFIASPSRSLTEEHHAEDLLQQASEDVPSADDALSGMVESEVIGEAPSFALSDDEVPEPMISDEAGSQTQMGNIGQMISGTSSPRDPKLSTHDRSNLSLNDEQGSFTTLGTPKRLNADGSERPMLVIKSDGEDLFSQALADIDALEGDVPDDAPQDDTPQDDASQDDSLEEHAGEDESIEVEDQIKEPGAALGRLKLKRVAVPRHGLLNAPIVERSRVVAQEGVAIQGNSETEDHNVAQIDEEIGDDSVDEDVEESEKSSSMSDILADDDILAGFQSALDDDESEETSLSDEVTKATGGEGMDATREFDASELFNFTGDGEDGLDEATSAAMGEAHARIERLNKMIRNANHSVHADQITELGAQGTDGEIEPPAAGMRMVQPTRSNQALTHDSIKKMRQSTMDLSSDLLFSGTNSPGLPAEVDDSRLLRAALMILISQDLIKIDELIALAKSLPQS